MRLNPDGRRRGLIRWGLIVGVLVVVAALGSGYLFMGGESEDAIETSTLALTTAQRGPLTISIAESGTIKPREQIILKNELDDPTTILYVVPEGTHVEAGELLVELDVTPWEDLLVERRIRLQNSEAEKISANETVAVVENQGMADVEQGELNLRFAKEDLEKYIAGEYPMQMKRLRSQITVATEELNQAKEELVWSQRLFEEKYLSQSDLQQDQLAAQRAEIDLELAQEELRLFEEYTHKREMAQLQSDVRQAELALERIRRRARADEAESNARMQAANAEYEEDLARVRNLESQVAKAQVTAPIDGIVLYATSMRGGWRRQNDEPIGVGGTVYERDEIIYLPTMAAYNVELKVPEVNLNKINPGMEANVKVDALPGQAFQGEVASISPMPDADQRWLNPNLKQYTTIVELDDGTGMLRNGMSCRTEIVLARYEDAVYVPVQSVTRVEGQPTVYVVAGGRIIPQPVELGPDNNVFVVIEEGLEGGESIMLEPPLGQGGENRPQQSVIEDSGGYGGGGRGGRRTRTSAVERGRDGENKGQGRQARSLVGDRSTVGRDEFGRSTDKGESSESGTASTEPGSSLSRFEPRQIGGNRFANNSGGGSGGGGGNR